MQLRDTQTSYGIISRFLHWLLAVLVIGMLIYGFCLHFFHKAFGGTAVNMHKLLGLAIFFLMLFRLLWMFSNVKPELPPETKAWERFLERVVHYGLYFFVIAMPLSGWIGSSAAQKFPRIQDFQLKLPVPQSKEIVRTAFNLHELFAYVIIALLCMHVGAALFHEFVRKDDIFRRMLP